MSPFRDTYLSLIEAMPQVHGRFTGVRRLGMQGGNGNFSLMFTAFDAITGQRVVLKVFNPDERGDAYRLVSFSREQQLLQKLGGQPGVIQLICSCPSFQLFGNHGGMVITPLFDCYAVELARGSVADEINTANLDWSRKLLIFQGMCQAVYLTHIYQIAHRDIKPDNFLIMPDNSVKLSDFGTAREIVATIPGLRNNYVDFPPGDRRYTAPELLASLHDADAGMAFGADVFSLGACLFEIFAGVPLSSLPFRVPFLGALGRTANMAASPNGVLTKDEFGAFMDVAARRHTLPSISGVNPNVPIPLGQQVDGLYQVMAALDFRYRLSDFAEIDRRINSCLSIAP